MSDVCYCRTRKYLEHKLLKGCLSLKIKQLLRAPTAKNLDKKSCIEVQETALGPGQKVIRHNS